MFQMVLLASMLLPLHNAERDKHSIVALKEDSDLMKFAQSHADWMASNRRLQHQNLGKIRGNWRIRGENIASGQTSESGVMRSWMRSSGHRANILNRRYTHMGFGAAKSKGGRLYWCVVFGGRK